MNKEEKIKIAITAGVAALVLLILVSVLTLSGILSNRENDEEKLAENITEYAASSNDAMAGASGTVIIGTQSREEEKSDASGTGTSDKKSAAKETTGKETGSAEDFKTETASKTGSSTASTSANLVSGFYATKPAELKDKYGSMKVDIEAQLQELFRYWGDGNMDAVRDLVHLDRFETVSYSLKGSKDYYYFGDKNSSGQPNGTGVAVYANDQYYYGQWVNGMRSGEGTWISFYPSYSDNVVKEHLYTGQWSDDFPNGQGQEHYDYHIERMKKDDTYIQNAIGGFAGGFYNGEMYIISIEKNEKTTEWIGQCTSGIFEQVLNTMTDKKGRLAVLSERENFDHHFYMFEKDTKNHGVSGIISGGKIK